MNARTRQFLSLISEDAGHDVLRELADGPASVADLNQRTGASKPTVQAKLDLLSAFGLAAPSMPRSSGRGRRPRAWQLCHGDWFAELEAQVEKALADLNRIVADDHAATSDTSPGSTK